VKLLAAIQPQIQIGGQPTFGFLGFQLDTYIVVSTFVAAAIVLALVLRLHATATSGVPSKLQLLFETVVDQVTDLTGSAIGPEGAKYVPLGVFLFLFILICNWFEFIPTSFQVGVSPDLLPAPTSDVNLPAALAVMVFVLIHYTAVRTRGVGGYFKHYAKPFGLMTPINVIEEITKPITLTFRLFGNLFAGSLMILVVAVVGDQILGSIGGGVATLIWTALWKPFGLFIGFIQALIFALLTIMYLGMASSTEH
jgi:F-type H+-transporting ATPase subunit a